LRPDDEIALMVFHTEAFLAQNFTKDRALILEKIMHPRYDYQSTVPLDNTHIADSIYQATEQLNKAASPANRRVMIVVTDNRPWEKWIRHSRKAVRNELFESGAVVYGVLTKGRPYLPGGGLVNFTEKWHGLLVERRNKGGKVNDYADPTGGIVIDAREGDLIAKLDELVDLLRGRYSFGYRPENSTIDSRVRQIKLKVSRELEKRENKLVIVSRKGYIRRGCPN
jgi:VWFA-related protein